MVSAARGSENRKERAVSRRPAKTIQADIARAIRAAKQTGAGAVIIRPDGTIVIGLSSDQGELLKAPVLAPEIEFEL